MKNKQKNGYGSRPLKSAATVLLILIVAVVISFVLIYRSHQKAVSGTIKTTNIPANSDTTSGNGTNNLKTTPAAPEKSSSGDQKSTNSSSILAPYGSFVSNHKPGQNGSNMTEVSQCITSPGANCYINFTQGSVVKTLPEKTADSSGSIFWEWNVNDAGLTSGTWTISAVASLNDQTKSTTDQLTLQVQ